MPTLFEDLLNADALTIDDESFRYFNLYQFDEGVDNFEDALCLEAGDYQFTFEEISQAQKEGVTWFVPIAEDDVLQVTCEKVIPF